MLADSDDTQTMLAAGGFIGGVITEALAVSVHDADAYARHARCEAERMDALAPVLLHQMSGGEFDQRTRATHAAARAATAFAEFRRVIEQVRA